MRALRVAVIGAGPAGIYTADTLPAEAVHRAAGYTGSHLDGLPFDHDAGVLVHDAGRVLDLPRAEMPAISRTT